MVFRVTHVVLGVYDEYRRIVIVSVIDDQDSILCALAG
jgi:hypothetical protein